MAKYACLFFGVLLLIGGCDPKKPKLTAEQMASIPLPQRSGLPDASGGFVLAVADQTITSEEIVEPIVSNLKGKLPNVGLEQFKRQYRSELNQIVASRISQILIYKQAEKEAGENIKDALEKATEAEVRRFIINFGGDVAKAEQALSEMGMDWQKFRDYQKKMILTQSYIQQKLPKEKPITYSELTEYYNRMKEKLFTTPARMQFAVIDIQPAKLELDDPNQSRDVWAKQLAAELLERLNKGEDFGELAKQYSHGHRAGFGGVWKPVNPESLAEPYDALAAAARDIEPGQIAGPIEAGGHIFIMKLLEKQAKTVEPLEKVQKQIEARIMFDHRLKAMRELEARMVEQAAISNVDQFVDFCLEEIYRRAVG